MAAVAIYLYNVLVGSSFAVVAAIGLVVADRAVAGRMAAFVVVRHINSPSFDRILPFATISKL
jgi:hypothetical protein